MKKRTLLTLLPFAIIAAGCSGSLKKGSIFNDKFLKMNSLEPVIKEEYEVDNEVVLNFGEGVTVEGSLLGNDLLTLKKADGSEGLYSLTTRKTIIPCEAWKASSIDADSVTNPFEFRFFRSIKEVEGKDIVYVYDEHGNLLYSGENGLVDYVAEEVNSFKENAFFRIRIEVNGIAKAYASYGLDLNLQEVLSATDYLAKYPYASLGQNLAEFGHEELVEKVINNAGEYRHMVFNTKKGKYVASFAIPQANPIRIGDYYYYQTTAKVHERENKYDYMSGGNKYNLTTHRVNYVNGKESTIKTNILFSSFVEGSGNMVDAKNVKKYYFAVNVQSFENKTLNPIRQNLLLDQNLKVVADVSGIDLSKITQFGDFYRIGKVIYDSKLREVGYLEGMLGDYSPRIAKFGQAYGLLDHTGKWILNPVYDWGSRLFDNNYYYYTFNEGDLIKTFKVNEKEEVQYVGSYSDTEYSWDHSTASNAHIVFEKNEDHKLYIYNYLDSSFTLAKELETGDIVIRACDNEDAINDTYRTDAVVFQRGGEYRAIFNSTHVTYSLPDYFPTK